MIGFTWPALLICRSLAGAIYLTLAVVKLGDAVMAYKLCMTSINGLIKGYSVGKPCNFRRTV